LKLLAPNLLLGVGVVPLLLAQQPAADPPEIISHYLAGVKEGRARTIPPEEVVTLIGRVSSLNLKGTMTAVRSVSEEGKLSYKVSSFEGDNSIKQHLIARYLSAEVEAFEEKSQNIGIHPVNYKFEYRGLLEQYGTPVHVFVLTPRFKKVGLFRGELWIDPETFLPVREFGLFVRSPSVFLKDIYFVRDYWIQNGRSALRRLISNIDVRIIGRAELTIWYGEPPEQEPAAASGNR